MAQISISDLYRGEGPGEKYGGILNAVFHEVFTKGIPEGCSEQTWIELLTMKHTFLVAERMKKRATLFRNCPKRRRLSASERRKQRCVRICVTAPSPILLLNDDARGSALKHSDYARGHG